MSDKRELSPKLQQVLLDTLETRFGKHMHRHPDIKWEAVKKKLEAHPEKMWSLYEMERTDGEPDVVGTDPKTGAFLFYDCSEESPKGRRSLCYDWQALEDRKEHKPKGNAVDSATVMGVELLTEEEYAQLQKLEAFDLKTSSWLKTPESIRKLGGAIFGDRRFDHVFTYHNGASSYYAARGFRCVLKV